jgi:hypothetical protein
MNFKLAQLQKWKYKQYRYTWAVISENKDYDNDRYYSRYFNGVHDGGISFENDWFLIRN